MISKLKYTGFLLILITIFVTFNFVDAQDAVIFDLKSVEANKSQSGDGRDNLIDILFVDNKVSISGIYDVSIIIGGILAVIYIGIGGLKMIGFANVTSLRDEGKKTVFNAIFGLLILIFVAFVLNVISPAIIEENKILSFSEHIMIFNIVT